MLHFQEFWKPHATLQHPIPLILVTRTLKNLYIYSTLHAYIRLPHSYKPKHGVTCTLTP